MDLTIEEYVNFLNHLLVHEYLDTAYHFSDTISDSDSLLIL